MAAGWARGFLPGFGYTDHKALFLLVTGLELMILVSAVALFFSMGAIEASLHAVSVIILREPAQSGTSPAEAFRALHARFAGDYRRFFALFLLVPLEYLLSIFSSGLSRLVYAAFILLFLDAVRKIHSLGKALRNLTSAGPPDDLQPESP